MNGESTLREKLAKGMACGHPDADAVDYEIVDELLLVIRQHVVMVAQNKWSFLYGDGAFSSDVESIMKALEKME